MDSDLKVTNEKIIKKNIEINKTVGLFFFFKRKLAVSS
tara:strand:- start:426 stop:539 length:114 start_codon:yes stop_codon:yes gene_type:complete